MTTARKSATGHAIHPLILRDTCLASACPVQDEKYGDKVKLARQKRENLRQVGCAQRGRKSSRDGKMGEKGLVS